MKIAALMGRGIEGCGNTKCMLGMKSFFEKNSDTFDVFATVDKVWGRRDAHNFIVKSEFKAENKDQAIQAIKDLNTYDLVILFSVPSTSHSEKCIHNFIEILKLIKKPKVYIQVDHSIHSINRNARLVDICNNVDLVTTHSVHGDFAKWLNKNNIVKPLKQFIGGYDYDTQRKLYWLDINEQDHYSFKFIGRSAHWKGPELFYKLHREYLRPECYLSTLEGMELSIGSLTFFFKGGLRDNGPREDMLACLGKKDLKFDQLEHGGPSYVFGPYNFDECMKRLNKTAFGADLYNLAEHKYGKSIENCHSDIIGCGSIPVFHKHFGTHCKSIVDDKPFIEHSNTGTLWLDDNNCKEISEEMLLLSKDLKARDQMREDAFKFWKDHSDVSITYPYFIDQIKEVLK